MQPKQLVQRWIEAFNRADADALAAMYAEDAINHQVAESPVRGRDAIRAMFAREFAAADMTCLVENLFEDGEWAILEWRDPLGMRGCGFFHVVDGRIAFQRGYWDKLSFLRVQGLPLPTRLIGSGNATPAIRSEGMFSHIHIGITDFERAYDFYRALADCLGLQPRFVERDKPWAGWQSPCGGRPLLLIGRPQDGRPHEPGNGQMTAFLAASRRMVDDAYRVALAHGGADEGAPGLRPHYHANYYGAYFRDPDGNKLCVVCHQEEAEVPASAPATDSGTNPKGNTP